VANRIFVDSVYVVALVNHRDQLYRQADRLSRRFEGQALLTTEAVLLEIGNALARNFKLQAVAVIEEFLSSADVEIVQSAPALFERAFALYKTYLDKSWSLVDCISFIVMRDLGITQALTCDAHFRQAGFELLMENIE